MGDFKDRLTGSNGSRADWAAKVQILGSPARNWSLAFQPDMIEGFLRAHMAEVHWAEPKTENGETNIRFEYTFPPRWTDPKSFGTLRLDPTPGASFERLSYGMVHDLLEQLAAHHPENTDMVVVFSEFRAMVYTPGLPRDEAIFRLSDDVDPALSRALFPAEWGSEGQG